MIKIDGNMLKLWQIVCKNIILTLVHWFVLLYELSTYAQTWITSRRVKWQWWAPGYTTGFLEFTDTLHILLTSVLFRQFDHRARADLLWSCWNITAHMWKKLETGFLTFEKNLKNLHDITCNICKAERNFSNHQ